MNININNSNRSFNMQQGAKKAPGRMSSLKNYGVTRNIAFGGGSEIREEKSDKKEKAKNIALKTLKAAALVAIATAAYCGGKNILSKKDEFSLDGVDFDVLKEQTDGLLGKGFFDETFQKTGWENYENIKETTFVQDVASTLSDIPGIPLDIINSSYKLAHKTPKSEILINRAKKLDAYDSKNLIINIISQYKKVNGASDDFARAIAKNINHTNPCYRIRDERVLNRLTTGLVSTYYAGNDFYNITMLKKDDKEEANKSANSRMKQEGSRMLINAAFSFFTLGALNKYIKNSKLGTVISAGLSTLFAEIFSRKISHASLKPLSSKEAYLIAQKNKAKQNVKDEKKESLKAPAPAFKGNTDSKCENDIFKDFTKEDGTFAALNEMAKMPEESKKQTKSSKKENKFLKILAGASALFSIYYILNSMPNTKGSIEDFYKKTHLSDLKKFIREKKVDVDVEKLKTELSELSTATTADGKNLAQEKGADKLLNTFNNIIGDLETNNVVENGKMQTTENRFIIAAIYDGFAKMGNTIAAILSLPGRVIKYAVDKLPKAQKTVNKVADEVTNKKSLSKKQIKWNKLSVKKLDEIINNGKNKNVSNGEIIDEIVNNVRDVKAVELEMSDLASDCRTFVTGISTYFFVNDYRNKVLIESEGKDVQGANAEAKERLAHKAFNFVFNGTLMNLFNNTFKGPINKHIAIAALVAGVTEFCNENLIRKSICSPAKRMNSKKEIMEYDEKQTNKKGFWGAYTKFFKKLTGKKTVVEKANVSDKDKK